MQNIKYYIKKLKELGFELAEEDIQDLDDRIIEKYINYPLLDNYLVELIKVGKIQETYEIIQDWYQYIKERLNADNNGITKDGFIDLVFENTFYDYNNKKYIFFDQEWKKENILVEFILYRAIQNLYKHNEQLNVYLPKEELEKELKIKKQEEYDVYEEELQNNVIDIEKRKAYSEQYKYIISSEEIKDIIREFRRFDKDNAELVQAVKKYEEENKNLKKENLLLTEEINKTKDMGFWNKIKNKKG